VTNPVWVETQHVGTPLRSCAFDKVEHLYQNGVPTLLASPTVRSSLNFYN
jgi:hypothetical protein